MGEKNRVKQVDKESDLRCSLEANAYHDEKCRFGQVIVQVTEVVRSGF